MHKPGKGLNKHFLLRICQVGVAQIALKDNIFFQTIPVLVSLKQATCGSDILLKLKTAFSLNLMTTVNHSKKRVTGYSSNSQTAQQRPTGYLSNTQMTQVTQKRVPGYSNGSNKE